MTPDPQHHQPARSSMFALEHPAFGDERQRHTWLESYVAAYEVALMTATAVAAVMVWVGGAPLAWWSLAALLPIVLGNVVSVRHLHAAGIKDLSWREALQFWGFRIRLLLGAVWVVGFLRHAFLTQLDRSGEVTPSYVAGLVVGAGAVIAAVVIGVAVARRRVRRREAEQPDDTFDD